MKRLLSIALALVLLTPQSAITPTAGGVGHAYPTYLKVMPFETNFDDRFHVYIFGSAERLEVRNPNGFDIPYNEVCYLTLDEKNRIVELKLN